MNLSNLPVSLNLHVLRAEAAAIEWAMDFGMIDDELVLKGDKILWFAAYALPDLEKRQLEQVTKFFFCLHYLDELLQHCSYLEAMQFFHRWEEYLFYEDLDTPFCSLWYALDNVLETMKNFSDQEWLDSLWSYLDDYLQARRWEYYTMKQGIIPGMNLFIMQHANASGIYLAIHFLKLNFPAKEYPLEWMEQRIARIICLSSDLRGFEYHKKSLDTHNELALRQIHTGITDRQACRHGAGLLSFLFDGLLEMIKEYRNENKRLADWADSLLLLLGGCLYWSEENALRYGTKINGLSKT